MKKTLIVTDVIVLVGAVAVAIYLHKENQQHASTDPLSVAGINQFPC